jgi:hypothetical protein
MAAGLIRYTTGPVGLAQVQDKAKSEPRHSRTISGKPRTYIGCSSRTLGKNKPVAPSAARIPIERLPVAIERKLPAMPTLSATRIEILAAIRRSLV